MFLSSKTQTVLLHRMFEGSGGGKATGDRARPAGLCMLWQSLWPAPSTPHHNCTSYDEYPWSAPYYMPRS
eukprot:4640817-Karenia_brevis.AAC.1